MDDSYKLSKEEHELIYQQILKSEFGSSTSNENPSIVILGGQPGCGKSGIIQLSKNDFSDGNVVIINGDDFRGLHPKSLEIFKSHEQRYAELTDPDVREWTSRLFQEAIASKRNIIFEGTMRNDGPICKTIQQLMQEGYKVHIRVMAVSEKESILGIHQRFEVQKAHEGFGRMTPIESHNAAYTGMLHTISRIENEKLFHSLQVYNRNNDLLYENTINRNEYARNPGVVQAIQQERTKEWSPEKWTNYFQQWLNVTKLMESRNAESEIIHAVNQIPKQYALVLKKERELIKTQNQPSTIEQDTKSKSKNRDPGFDR